MEVTLSRWYGGVILAAVFNFAVLFWQMFKVGKARKQYEVKYPTLYENKYPSDFNCIQRAHQNSLEWNPAFLVFLFIAGLSTPITSTMAGFVYNIGRIYHALGYYQGNPHKGLWGLFALFYLCFASVYTAFQIIKS